MRKLIYIIIVLLFAVEAHADNFTSRLAKASRENKTIIARFEQMKKVVGIKDEIKREGDFYYENSGKMALIYDKPKGDKIVMNGEEFSITIGDKNIESNASSNPMMAQISYMMQASMSGDINKLGKGWNMVITEKENVYEVIIKPSERRIKRYISSMTMIFCNKTMTIDELRIDEAKGGYTSYKFLSKEINSRKPSF